MEWLVILIWAAAVIVAAQLWSRGRGEISSKTAFYQTLYYVGAALVAGGFIWWWFDLSHALLYLNGFGLEYALSIDNLFVIAVVMDRLGVAKEERQRLLYLGIVGAIALRGVFILLGSVVIHSFWWVLPLMGVFLIPMGIHVILKGDEDEVPKLVTWMQELRWKWLTPFLVALICIEGVDLLFAIDSIPAIFGITTDPFLVFAASIFAVMGLRSLFFVLQGAKDKFHYLPKALGLVLILIGIKIILPLFGIHVPVWVGLIVTGTLIGAGIAASLLFPKEKGSAKQ